jgi:DNA-binding NarL/FixJ family response regulator
MTKTHGKWSKKDPEQFKKTMRDYMRETYRAKQKAEYRKRIEKRNERILLLKRDGVRIKDIARRVNLSPDHVLKIIKQHATKFNKRQ